MNCPTNQPGKIHSVTFIRGNRWTLTTGLRIKGDPAFDWSGITAVFRLRRSREQASPVLAEINPTITTGSGSALVVVDIPGTVSATLPESFVGDLVCVRTSPAYGPYTPVQIDFSLTPAA